MNAKHRLVLGTLVAATLLIVPSLALAQRDAGAKARGDYGGSFWSTKSATRSVRHALDYSRGAHEYVTAAPKASPQYLRADAAEIGKNLAQAKAEIDYLQKSAANNKEITAAIASVQKHLTAADAEFHTFHAQCEKDTIDAGACAKCCSALSDHLTKAHDELEALQKKLASKPTTTQKK